MFNVYSNHNGSNILMPPMETISEVRGLADAAASLGYDALYRAFETDVPRDVQNAGFPVRERFEVSFSVLDGVVRQLDDPGIPTAHWGR